MENLFAVSFFQKKNYFLTKIGNMRISIPYFDQILAKRGCQTRQLINYASI